MSEYSAPPPELVIYPSLWQRSRERFPHDWQWPDHGSKHAGPIKGPDDDA